MANVWGQITLNKWNKKLPYLILICYNLIMIIVGGGLMKKVYLDNIPRNNKGNIDWGTLKDYQVYFTYNEINDYLIIKEVIGEMLTVSYHGKEGKISQTNLKRARLYNIVKGINNTYSFKYEIGKTVTTNEGTEYSIIGRYKNKSKMYTIKCENCNVAYDVTEAFVNRKSRPTPKEEQKLNRKKIFVYDKIDDSTTSFNSIAELERNGENLFNVKFTHIGEIASSMSKGRKTPYKNRFFFAYDIPQLQRLSERTSQ